jgi:hypothetical protein
MRDTFDDDLTLAFSSLADRDQPPLDATAGIAQRVSRRRIRIATASALSAAFVLLGGVAVVHGITGSSKSAPTVPVSSDDEPAWHSLTGKDVGTALGLTAYPLAGLHENAECVGRYYVEYVDKIGFCYTPEDLGITDPLEAQLLALQITGYPRTDDLIHYAQVRQQMRDLNDRMEQEDPEAMEEFRELGHQLAVLGERIEAQRVGRR